MKGDELTHLYPCRLGCRPRADAAARCSWGQPRCGSRTERWEQRYNGPADLYDAANDLALSPDGSMVYVTGVSDDSGPTFDDYTTLAYDAGSGDLVWATRLRGGAQDIAEAVAASPDGSTVWVTGTTHWAPGGYDYTTEAYDAATGANTTERKFNWAGRSADNATALAISPDGSKIFVTGYSEGSPGDYDFATVAYPTSG